MPHHPPAARLEALPVGASICAATVFLVAAIDAWAEQRKKGRNRLSLLEFLKYYKNAKSERGYPWRPSVLTSRCSRL